MRRHTVAIMQHALDEKGGRDLIELAEQHVAMSLQLARAVARGKKRAELPWSPIL